MMANNTSLILASASPIRAHLLEGAGLTITTHAADIDERALEANFTGSSDSPGSASSTRSSHLTRSSPAALAEHLAHEKAKAVSALFPDALVIGTDQVLVHEGHVLHKATSRQSARDKLQKLQNQDHTLISAAALARHGKTVWSGQDSATLSMRALSEADIEAYLDQAGDASTQSVGAYRLEELGASLFDDIKGGYFTILGLPLLALLKALRAEGFDPIYAPSNVISTVSRPD